MLHKSETKKTPLSDGAPLVVPTLQHWDSLPVPTPRSDEPHQDSMMAVAVKNTQKIVLLHTPPLHHKAMVDQNHINWVH